jgi:hypothetical protein
MNNDLLDILTDDNNDFDNQKLMDYLNGKLSGDEKHEVEKWMADNNITNDAVEGLQNIKEKKNLPQYVEQLNNNLQLQLEKKRDYRIKRKLKDYPWIYFAIILILIFCIIAYVIIAKFLRYL